MKRVSIVLLLPILLFFYLPLQAQFKEIARSVAFDEPETGDAKIFLLSNGSTCLFLRSTNNELQYRLFDPSHKEIISTGLNVQKMNDATYIQGPFEIKRNIVLFFTYRSKNAVDLKRVTIDAATGKMLEDVLVLTVGAGGFGVYKDPESDSYAISKTDTKSKTEEENTFTVYDGDHKASSPVSCNGPANDAANYFPQGEVLLVNGTVYAFGIQRPKRNASYVIKGPKYMAVWKIGSPAFEYIPLNNIPEDLVYSRAIAKYNKQSNRIFFMIDDEDVRGTTKETVFFNSIDAGSKKVTAIELKTADKISVPYKERFGKKKEFTGRPLDFHMNDDGSFAMVYQDLFIDESGKNVDIFIGHVLVANYDSKGICTSTYILPKNHVIHNSNWVGVLSFHNREGNPFGFFGKGNQFKLIKYINGPGKKYLLFNDIEQNNEVKNDKYAMMTGVSMSDAFFFRLTGDALIPKREYVFDAGAARHTFINFAVCVYDKKSNVLVTLISDKNSVTDRMVNMVWLQPQ